jgi:hypothetical protein
LKKIHGTIAIVGLIALAMLFASCGTTIEENTLEPEPHTKMYGFTNVTGDDVTVTVTSGAGTFDASLSSADVSDPKKFTLKHGQKAWFKDAPANTVTFTAKAKKGGVKVSSFDGFATFTDL